MESKDASSPFEIDAETGLPIGPRVSPEAAPRPAPIALHGRFVHLEPLAAQHDESLFAATSGATANADSSYLAHHPPADLEDLRTWREELEAGGNQIGWAVVDRATSHAEGHLFLMRVKPQFRSVEVGNIHFGPRLQRTPGATEAIYLIARHAMDDLGYRRFEWKCDALNARSRRAATRLGFRFEGTFRRHMIVKGRSRDTAWFSMIDEEWPALRAGLEAWLEPDNFGTDGGQLRSLSACRER